MKRVLAFGLSLIALAMASFAVSGAASGADQPPSDTGPNGEKSHADFTLSPQNGDFYQGGVVPASWKINVLVSEPYTGPTQDIYPLKQVHLRLPTDLTFNPDPNMPVCTDAKMNPSTNLSIPPKQAIAICPKSVIGNGTAALYLSHKNKPDGPGLKDPVLIVFNGGIQDGKPRIKIYGFSKGTGVGIFMQGVLENDGTLIISVPRLSNDSAVGNFDLNIPGLTPIKYDYRTVPESVGQDKNYLRAKCSTGNWLMTSQFILGTRDDASNPTSDNYPVDAPDFNLPCVGKPGKPPVAKIGKVTVKGPASVKKGKVGAYKVTVKNTGTAPATGVKVTAAGKGAKGSATAGTIAAGKSKTVTVKVKFTGKGKTKVTFTAKSQNGGSAKAVKTVTVK